MKIDYIHEPTDLQCGQAVLAMVLGKTPEYICRYLNNHRETDLKEMKRCFREHGVDVSDQRVQAYSKEELPPLCMLSLETPRCWHWSLYCEGTFYDPEHGVLNDFPQSKRKYFWELKLQISHGSFISPET
ncbi:hypothetical protein [Ruminococcus flavefaciens]|uniref:Peptidase C39 domain-containing protein n=1 Tax=Ruminococcus flavefaciens 007c TaxID=1341157 RepID=W7UN57_RUMFL|nr:hypothetical protein [Ruminococcus flavefaciens]EWM55223.1 hypothetical protein RF007C_04515 [Ruminococcus flavefaciens 007c]